MLTFHRTFQDEVLIVETGRYIKNCKLYNISRDGTRIGRFYSGDNYSFAEFDDQKIRIDPKKRFFVDLEYPFRNQYTDELLGSYTFRAKSFFDELDTRLHLSGGESYEWKRDFSIDNRLSRGTSRLYKFDLVSNKHLIVYYGKMTPDVTKSYVNPNQVFEGEIQSTDETFLLPIFMGIFFMEEAFRVQEQEQD